MAVIQHRKAQWMFAQLVFIFSIFLATVVFFSWYLSPRLYLWWQMIFGNTHAACGCELTPFFGFDSMFMYIALGMLVISITLLLFFVAKIVWILFHARISRRNHYFLPHLLPDYFTHLVSALRINKHIQIIDQEKPVVFCYGYMRPRIVISQGMMQLLNEQELRAVLLHEKYHLIHRNPLQTLFIHTAAAVFFFVPGLRRFAADFQTQLEIAADEMAVEAGHNTRHIAGALYALLDYQQVHGPSFALFFHGHIMEQRIDALSGKHHLRSTLSWNSIVIALFFVLSMVVFMRFNRAALAQYDVGLCRPEYISQQCRDLVRPACVMSYEGRSPDCR